MKPSKHDPPTQSTDRRTFITRSVATIVGGGSLVAATQLGCGAGQPETSLGQKDSKPSTVQDTVQDTAQDVMPPSSNEP